MRDLAIIARSRPARIAGWTLAAILALAAAAACGLALWRAPGWMHAATSQDRYNARVLVISVGGAIVVGTGLLYTARNYRLSRRGQVTDRFTIALERLGSSELYVRIGGVHALEHVMRDSADHHNDVIEVLTEFIRDRAPRRARQSDHFALQSDHQAWMHPVTGSIPDLPSEPTPDIQAALTALGHRPHRPERQTINLIRLHLANTRLTRANLTGAQLDRADLTGADLVGADLTDAGLVGADLTRAQLTRANLTGAVLIDADLTGAGLVGADLTRARLVGADLTHAWLTRANLAGAQLVGADLTGAQLGSAATARIHGWLKGADLTYADLTGALWPLSDAVPEGWQRDNDGRLKRPDPGPRGEATW